MADVLMQMPVSLPSLPNFIKVGGESLDIAEIPDEKLRELAMSWGEALVLHAQTRRAVRLAGTTL